MLNIDELAAAIRAISPEEPAQRLAGREILAEAEYPSYLKKMFRIDKLHEKAKADIIEKDKKQYLDWLNRKGFMILKPEVKKACSPQKSFRSRA
jgi:hypothetical protein